MYGIYHIGILNLFRTVSHKTNYIIGISDAKGILSVTTLNVI